ncbi:MAG: COX15/CtaA family protein, partial [Planctomycetota bacterium]|nr:COX15/CtaA family protein [Planctomycetota bacterium]
MAPALVFGFGASVAAWIVWFITHIPWTGLSGPVQTGLVIATWAAGMILAGRSASSPGQGAARGLLSGVITAMVGLLLLGSKINASGGAEKPNALLIVGGFLGFGAALGFVGGLVGSFIRPATTLAAPDWLARFAGVVTCIAAPLLFVGGLVTSTNSGMAVPDWPQSYGMNMFLYPLGTAPTDVFLEHSHRLFGTFLGLGSLTLMIWTVVSEPRRGVKAWAIAIFVFILLQGLLGGIRVTQGNADAAQDNRWLSMFHGVSAQLIFAALVALWVILTPTYKNSSPDPKADGASRLRGISAAAMHSTILQMVFGAMYRHVRSVHALWTHAGFSLLVVIFASLAGFLGMKQRENIREGTDPSSPLKLALARIGSIEVLAVGIQ